MHDHRRQKNVPVHPVWVNQAGVPSARQVAQMHSAFRTVFINVAVLIGLVLGILFLSALAGDAYNLAKTIFPKQDKRAALPVYEDQEYALQIFRDQKGRIKDYVPYVEWRHSPFASQTLNVDESGYRVHNVGRDNAPNAVTIGFFGGSTMWGTGVDDDGTIAAQFDAITQGYDVTNYGERGYTTLQNLIDLVTLINQGRAPMVVVFYEGFNDVWVHCDYAVTERLNSHMEERRMQSALDRTEREDYLYNTIIAPLVDFTTRVTGSSNVPHKAACSNDPERANAVAEMFVRTLEMAQTLVDATGGRFYAALQPHAYFGSPRVDHLDLVGQRHDGQRAEFAAVYPLIVQKMGARGHDWFIDLSQALDGEENLFIDHAHITARGNELIARLIAESVN
jgi:lysophospholipase L1-like esterase